VHGDVLDRSGPRTAGSPAAAPRAVAAPLGTGQSGSNQHECQHERDDRHPFSAHHPSDRRVILTRRRRARRRALDGVGGSAALVAASGGSDDFRRAMLNVSPLAALGGFAVGAVIDALR
jgi:hypothetical protein